MLTLLYQRPNSRKILALELFQKPGRDVLPLPVPSEQVVFKFNGTASQALQAYLNKDKKPNVAP